MKTTEENLQILKDMNAMRKTQKRSEMIEAWKWSLESISRQIGRQTMTVATHHSSASVK
jgi:hypothetical protein